MKSVIRKFGNSHGVIIPKLFLEEIGAQANDAVDVRVKKGRIVISLAARDARAGWADESKALAAAGEDGLVWPEFGRDANDKPVW